MSHPAPPKPTITILAEDLFALAECRMALADLVHVIECEPKAGFTTAELRDGYDAWLGDAVTRARLATELGENVALPPAPAPAASPGPRIVTPPGPVIAGPVIAGPVIGRIGIAGGRSND